MQTLDKVRDEARDRVPRPSAPKRIAARASKGATTGAAKGAGKVGKGVFSRIASAVTDLAKGLTGRKQAERRRKRNVTAAAAGAATATGAAGLYLAKRSLDGSKAAQAAPPEAYAPPVPNPNPNGQSADVTTGTGSPPA